MTEQTQTKTRKTRTITLTERAPRLSDRCSKITSASLLDKVCRRHSREDRDVLLRSLKRHDWNVGATARWLGVHVTTLRRAIVTHGLSAQLEKHGHGAGRPRKEKS